MVDTISMMMGFGFMLVLSLLFLFFIKGGLKEFIIFMGIFSIFAFIGGMMEFWVIILLLILSIMSVMFEFKSKKQEGGS